MRTAACFSLTITRNHETSFLMFLQFNTFFSFYTSLPLNIQDRLAKPHLRKKKCEVVVIQEGKRSSDANKITTSGIFVPNCKFLFKLSNRINPFPNKPWFLRVCSTNLLKTLWEKEKLLVTSNFSFSHSVFYLLKELFAVFVKFEIVVCKCFQFGRV